MNLTNQLNPFVQMVMNVVHNFCDFHSNTWNLYFYQSREAVFVVSEACVFNPVCAHTCSLSLSLSLFVSH